MIWFQVASTSVCLPALWAHFWHCRWTCCLRECWYQYSPALHTLAWEIILNMKASLFLLIYSLNLSMAYFLKDHFSVFACLYMCWRLCFHRENLLADCLQGCFVVTCTLCAFISLVWLREQIVHGGAPQWLEQHQPPPPNAAGQANEVFCLTDWQLDQIISHI